ncbi:outer membrane protein, OMP85 family [Aulographum hederae CBS 113979]|uniref:Outer membrane protein, OMP85 family n=1 Tax=Aulographum hederae CBS 113979 TaxID=1176131 RepID=A0A6G1GSA5_9PEZI|nr:outer membrane protein, OMP85 family [Aulographum hederae CBS 113979]
MADQTGDSIFERLKQKPDPRIEAKRQQEINASIQQQYEKSQQRIAELIGGNSSLPVTISSIRVLQAKHTRRGFLEKIFNPILSSNNKGYYTLEDALQEVSVAAGKLNRFGIFKEPISIYIDKPEKSDPSTSPTDIAVFISAAERPRSTVKTGTEAGNVEGNAFASAELRNIFGGAESLNAYASLGTRTRSAYSLAFQSPILSNPDLLFEVGGLASSTSKYWASHEEALKSGSGKLKWTSPWGHKHEFGYGGTWRQITELGEKASPTVRADAGDSYKSSITHSWINDKRDFPLLPSRGYLMKAVTELAGLGPLNGDVGFGKVELETQAALPIPVPGIEGDSGVSFTMGLRGGLLCPLPIGMDSSKPAPSRINDRFQLGGPTDVRGFRLSGMGPRDGQDSVGGDVYAAGGASLLFPLPRAGKDTPLRLQAFINGGKLMALDGPYSEEPMTVQNTMDGLRKTFQKMGDGLPSCAAGVGLVYVHPVARFEINFSLPLVIREGELGRKGLTFGVGMNFL